MRGFPQQARLFTIIAILMVIIGSLRAEAQGVVDQQQLVYDAGISARTLPGYKLWQSFTAGLSGNLTGIDMGFFTVMNGDGTLQIFAGQGTGGALLQTLNVKVVVTVPTYYTMVHWTVNVPVVAGKQYTFQFTPNSHTLPDPYGVAASFKNVYVGGTLAIVDPSGTYPGMDLLFRTYVTTGTGVNSPVTAQSLAITPSSVVGGVGATGTLTLSGPAPVGGVVAKLASSSAYVAVPATVTVPAGALQANFPVTTHAVSAALTATVTATEGGVTVSAPLTVSPNTIQTLVLSSTSVTGGTPVTATLTLAGPAPLGGITVGITSSDPSVAVPAAVVIPAGASRATFPVSTAVVQTVKTATITAVVGAASARANLTVNPMVVSGGTDSISGFELDDSQVQTGDSSGGIIVLSSPAPAGGVTVVLKSSNSVAVNLPTSIFFPAGASRVKFGFVAGPVSAATTVTVTVSVGNSSKSATVQITP